MEWQNEHTDRLLLAAQITTIAPKAWERFLEELLPIFSKLVQERRLEHV
ncbi:hypothetical protein [Agrobacterium sp. fls2-241-TYG-188a]|nr:hypothetical protein [Agrobacterium sp. fls2-241-TYG-188a]